MEETPLGKITEHFGKVRDPRIGNATRHKFLDIIVIAICAVVCGGDGGRLVAGHPPARPLRDRGRDYTSGPQGLLVVRQPGVRQV